jgi:hypothetical protein
VRTRWARILIDTLPEVVNKSHNAITFTSRADAASSIKVFITGATTNRFFQIVWSITHESC